MTTPLVQLLEAIRENRGLNTIRKLAEQVDAEALAGREMESWQCFHCGETFTDREAAALHFGDYGPRSYTDAACLITPEKLREMEFLLQHYQEEDGPIHRLMHRQAGEHAVALRRAEEAGYARALKDTNWKEPDPASTPSRAGGGEVLVGYLDAYGDFMSAEMWERSDWATEKGYTIPVYTKHEDALHGARGGSDG